ncbi:MAG: TAXI family TRAP transporter solute-binding subunit [Longimicrobiales bacterium]
MSRRAALGRLYAWVAGSTLLGACDPREFARRHGATQRLSVATGGTGGVYYPYGGAIAAVITRHVRNVEATAEVTGGSIDNLKFIAQDQADLGFTLADTLADAYAGTGAFETYGRVPAAALARLYTNYTHLVTVSDQRIASLADLRDRIVSTGEPGSGTETIARRILQAAGIDPATDLRSRALGAAGSVEALRDGKIDAFFWSGGVPTGALLDLASAPGQRMRLVANDAVLPALRERFGDELYLPATIVAGAYPGIDEPIGVIGVANLLAAHRSMSADLAYEITRALFEHRAELLAVHPEARHLEPGFASAGSPVPFHEGAVRYYRQSAAAGSRRVAAQGGADGSSRHG